MHRTGQRGVAASRRGAEATVNMESCMDRLLQPNYALWPAGRLSGERRRSHCVPPGPQRQPMAGTRGQRVCVCGGRAAPQEAAKPSASRPWSVRCSPLINAETSQHTSSVECWLGSAITRGRTARSAGSRGASGGALDHLQRSSALADGLGRLRARRHAAPTPQARLRLGRRRTTPAWRQPLFHWLWSLSAGPAVLPDGSHPELRH